MTVFYSIAALLIVLVLAWLVRPLLRPAPLDGVSSQRLNADICREQLDALARDLASGGISPADYETARDELQLRLLDDTDESAVLSRPSPMFWTKWRTIFVVALLLPLGTGGFYYWLGTPQAIDPLRAKKMDDDKISSMVDGLAAKLKANPDNPKGWAMLARSYKVMGRLQDAEDAYAKAGQVIETDPDLLADYADLLAVRAGDNLDGRPLELINKALALNPMHPMSLMLAATAAYRQGRYDAAVNYWEKLVPMMDPESPDMAQLQSDIDDARAKAGLNSAAPAAGGKPKLNQADTPQKPSNEQIVKMVEGLAVRLKANPDDLNGWARLARSYKVLGRLPESEDAYLKTGKLLETNPDVIADFADLLATRAGNNLEGKPLALIKKALALNPLHPMALMLSGSAALKRGDYAGAVATWEKLQPVLEPGSRDAEWLRSSLADARLKGGLLPGKADKK
jgi:cytochrome c-type biogenesis protein CcmH